MARRERRRADELDRYWDSVVRGDIPPAAGIDDITAAIISTFSAEAEPAVRTEAEHRIRQQVTGAAGEQRRRAEPMQATAVPVAAARSGRHDQQPDVPLRPHSILHTNRQTRRQGLAY